MNLEELISKRKELYKEKRDFLIKFESREKELHKLIKHKVSTGRVKIFGDRHGKQKYDMLKKNVVGKKTLYSIGKEYNITMERVNQIIKNGINIIDNNKI